MDENELIIKQIEANHPSWVHAGNSGAYHAFSNGKVVFDFGPNADLLREFQRDNASEFGSSILTDGMGGFRWLMVGNVRVYCTYHPHLHDKYYAQEQLWNLEQTNPNLEW